MMDVEQNSSNENDLVLEVFDGLLERVCYAFFNVLLCVFNVFFIYWYEIYLCTCFSRNYIYFFYIFQEFEGDFKPNITRSYIPNDLKGNLTYKCYNHIHKRFVCFCSKYFCQVI